MCSSRPVRVHRQGRRPGGNGGCPPSRVSSAQKVGRAIRAGIDRLIQFPSYGRAGDVEGTRQFVVADAPYIVVYEIEDETITILRVYHAAQDRPGSR